MKRGVVVELNDDFVTLLTPDGQFLKAANTSGNYQVGEEITFFPVADEREEAATKASKPRNYIDLLISKKAAGALVLAIMLFMISFMPLLNNDKVYAYMSIDINPSFEVGMNDDLRVISLEPLNEDAKRLLKNLPDWKNQPLKQIIDRIVAESKSKGYIIPGKEILITTVINKESSKFEDELDDKIADIRNSYEKEEMIVKAVESDFETREKALKQGISTGKFIQLQDKEQAVKETVKSVPAQSSEKNQQNDDFNKANDQTNQSKRTIKEEKKAPASENSSSENNDQIKQVKEKVKTEVKAKEKELKSNNKIIKENLPQKESQSSKKESKESSQHPNEKKDQGDQKSKNVNDSEKKNNHSIKANENNSNKMDVDVNLEVDVVKELDTTVENTSTAVFELINDVKFIKIK